MGKTQGGRFEVIDDDLGRSANGMAEASIFEHAGGEDFG